MRTFLRPPNLAFLFASFLHGPAVLVVQAQCVHCPEYVAATAAAKESVVMDKIVGTEYARLPPIKGACDVDYPWETTVDFNNQFDRFSDERSPGMDRFFHLNGAVASVRLDPAGTNHEFTGIFRGADHGVLRFSPLAPLLTESFLVNQFIGSFFFSFGLKFFRDSMHSANILTGNTNKTLTEYTNSRSFWELPDFNIFSRPVDNVPGIGSNGPLFGSLEKFAGVLSVADSAAYNVSGGQEDDPKTPFIVHFDPNPVFVEQFGRVGELDFRKWLKDNADTFRDGTLLYNLYTTVSKASGEATLCVDANGIPQADEDMETVCPDQERIKLGAVVLKSRFYASQWGDDGLFFQHTRFCPKDQSICSNFPAESLTQPYPSFADSGGDAMICLSDDDRDGEVSGIPPECPEGSSRVGDYCYPGGHRKVEETQAAQCPFIAAVDNRILGIKDEDSGVLDCTPGGRLRAGIFSSLLGGTSFLIRLSLFPFQLLGLA